ncbi:MULTISPECIES: FecR family protein [unclassified Pseudomonas]|uniref:FecR family protein n=1 Tax=unclassified Pseudomonas TaxID=196821 RepID=UPI000876EE40|nr:MULTISPECIES: FecR family protein [unclassified Pseudomonas]SCZ74556.1 FecR family protein [Pseudomonas sp. NFPP17]SDA82744.1 FecR family protein [Pseudomonas sp. NFPP15]SEL83971.1 FecR family protein [Pseudomonas sp. NFPP18]SFA67210.1 FecR family protein [Pseudomonas sp. NFPP13]SFU06259.1 FecR family protein [Pseudomonas sp. NFPP25]
MMDSRDCASAQARIRDEAAAWFTRLQEPEVSPEQQLRFQQWLAEDLQHRHEFQLLEALWAATDLVPRARLQALCATPPAKARRRPLLRFALAAGVAALAVGLGLFSGLNQPVSYSAQFVTALGERRHVALPDGSQIDLNSRSHLQVRYARNQRLIELVEGEALFNVEHDTDRPFVVAAGAGKVTVTGTRFDVRRDERQTRVAVEQGRVKVQGRDAATDDFIALTPGQGTHVDEHGKVAQAYAVNPEALTAWRSGKLVFNNASLAEVVAEVSRYREQPLRVASAAVGELRLTSVFKSDDTQALLKALPSILPVEVRTLADGSQEIFSR